MRSSMRANFPEGRECGMVVELTGSITGSQKLSWDEWPFCDEFTIIRALTSSTNKLLLEDLQQARNYRDAFAKHIKPNPYHGMKQGSNSLVSQNFLTKI